MATLERLDHHSVLCAPDKFRASASAQAVASAMARAAAALGLPAIKLPLSDGGEGLLEVLGGEARSLVVDGPLGDSVDASFRMLTHQAESPATAVIEVAQAAGLSLVGGPANNDPLAASTRGVGELVKAALESGATKIVIGCGGSASTDGGLGLFELLLDDVALGGVELVGAYDVTTTFLEAARVFAPQKGADEATVEMLSTRLMDIATRYRDQVGIDVVEVAGSGAAGGLGGAILALGGTLIPGFDFVASTLDLDGAIEGSFLVLTGEGRLDQTSFAGKVVAGVLSHARDRAPVGVIAGDVTDEARELLDETRVVSLTARYGLERSMSETITLIETEARALIASMLKR